jgi:ribosomal protein L6P/L9E
VPLNKIDKDAPSLAVAKGELGELTMTVPAGLSLRFDGAGTAYVDCDKDKAKALWPTMRSLVENMVIGVSQVR